MARFLPLLFFAAAALGAQPLTRGPHRIELTLERMDGSGWRAIDPGLVLASGDRVRFRFRSNFDGFLYVMNSGTSGSYTVLFPHADTGRDNAIKAGREYVVPATEAYFRIAGPPGQDIVYWLVSPAALSGAPGYVPLPPPPKPGAAPPNLTPRCDDAVFRARGVCVDSTAGPKNVTDQAMVPDNLSKAPGLTSRELVIMRQQTRSTVSSPAPLTGPVIYEFRLAHK